MSEPSATGWGVGGLLRLFVDERGTPAFETDIHRQVDEVGRQEPGTAIYGFFRERTADRSGLAAYLHVMVYRDEAAQQAHWDAEEVWWWPALSGHLKAPIESERFTEDQLLDAWRTGGTSPIGLVVADGDTSALVASTRAHSAFGWLVGRADSESPVVSPAGGSLLVVGIHEAPHQRVLVTALGGTSHDAVACLVRG
ncbi:hypothetical protein Drose_16725 [Dactylosporangium roseum]|uniref:ABM domain-containing protein n=1 Tax=Dactylosporangium roseum TaxID=47989 RepID=A0ABY5ZE64_9ACTN|nr:hypothetical protein [Dactylosporangium roseum]UWZ39712.1 hypothetical protein Drose_16725 [Dactylosporangium roseum]